MRLFAVLLAAGAALALAAPNRPAPAQDLPRNVQVDCNEYAMFARRVAVLRLVEARLDLVIRDIQRETGAAHSPRIQVLVREARRVYLDGLAPEEARFQAWLRCQAVLGRFGPEV